MYGEGVGMDVWMNFIWNEYETWHERTREDKEVSIEKDAEEYKERIAESEVGQHAPTKNRAPGTLRNPSNTLYNTPSAATQLDMLLRVCNDSFRF